MDDGNGHFAKAIVRCSEDAGFTDCRVGVAGSFDLGCRDILATANDDVLLAIDDEEITVFVDIPMSPVRTKPSGVNSAAVASGLRK